MRSRLRIRRNGFTFLEIMVVVAIIGILLSIVGLKLSGKVHESQEATTRLQMHNIETALEMYDMRVGDLPTTEQGLDTLVRRPTAVSQDLWRQYLKGTPLDGWKREFLYRCPGENGQEFDLISSGKDGQMGTSDDIVFSNEPARDAPSRD